MNVTCDSHSNCSHSQCCVWINQQVCEPLAWKEINIHTYIYIFIYTHTYLQDKGDTNNKNIFLKEQRNAWLKKPSRADRHPVVNPWHGRWGIHGDDTVGVQRWWTLQHYINREQCHIFVFYSNIPNVRSDLGSSGMRTDCRIISILSFLHGQKNKGGEKEEKTHTHKTKRNEIKSRFNLKGNQTEDGSWSEHAEMHNSFFIAPA